MRYLLLALALTAPLEAQQPATPPPPAAPGPPRAPALQRDLRPLVSDTGIFSPLDLPPANDLRRPDGAPGSRYWQQRVDYSIKASLDTAARSLSGEELIRYVN